LEKRLGEPIALDELELEEYIEFVVREVRKVNIRQSLAIIVICVKERSYIVIPLTS
jgi:hypothetical protein